MRTHDQIMADISATEKKLKRWRTRVKRGITALSSLEARKKRLEKLLLQPAPRPKEATSGELARGTDSLPVAQPPKPETLQEFADRMVNTVEDKLTIPGFLRRSKKDQDDIDKAKAERSATAKAKKAGQAERRKAQRVGDTKRMPLTGRAAAEFIAKGE